MTLISKETHGPYALSLFEARLQKTNRVYILLETASKIRKPTTKEVLFNIQEPETSGGWEGYCNELVSH